MKAGRPRSGNLYQMVRGKYVAPDENTDAYYYLRYMVAGKRHIISLHTKSHATALQEAARIMGATRYADAEGHLRALIEIGEQAKLRLAEAMSKSASAVPMATVWEAYVASKRRPASGESTMSAYKGQWERFRKWCPPTVETIAQVTPDLCERYIGHLEGLKMNPQTISKHVVVLRRVHAILCPGMANPWEGLHSTGEHVATHYRRLSPNEIAALFKAATGEYRMLLQIGYFTGLRRADACLLDWSEIDLAKGIITLVPRKTARRRRVPVVIPIVPGLRSVFEAVHKKRRTGHALPAIASKYRRDMSDVADDLAAIFEAAGVKDTKEGNASFHSLRVTWQSMADDAGVSRVVSRSVLGHASASMSDTYSRLDADRAAEQVRRAFAVVPK